MRILALYILTLILYFLVLFAHEWIEKYFSGNIGEDDKDEPVDEELTGSLIYLLLRVAAIVMFAVLPVVGQAGLWTVLLYASIFSMAVEIVLNVSNFSMAKEAGIKAVASISLQTLISTLIVAAGSYFMALYLLR